MRRTVLVLATAVSLTQSVRAQEPFEINCLQAFPDAIQARVELRDRELEKLIPQGGIGETCSGLGHDKAQAMASRSND